MAAARTVGLDPGSVLMLDGTECTVTDADWTTQVFTFLRAGEDEPVRLTLDQVQACTVSATGQAPLPPSRWDVLREADRKIVAKKLAHALEAATGYRSGDPDAALAHEPRPEYDPDLVPAYQRRANKAKELAEDPDKAEYAMSTATLRRFAERHAAGDPDAAVDGRKARRRQHRRAMTTAAQKAAWTVIERLKDQSTISMTTRYARICKILSEQGLTEPDRAEDQAGQGLAGRREDRPADLRRARPRPVPRPAEPGQPRQGQQAQHVRGTGGQARPPLRLVLAPLLERWIRLDWTGGAREELPVFGEEHVLKLSRHLEKTKMQVLHQRDLVPVLLYDVMGLDRPAADGRAAQDDSRARRDADLAEHDKAVHGEPAGAEPEQAAQQQPAPPVTDTPVKGQAAKAVNAARADRRRRGMAAVPASNATPHREPTPAPGTPPQRPPLVAVRPPVRAAALGSSLIDPMARPSRRRPDPQEDR